MAKKQSTVNRSVFLSSIAISLVFSFVLFSCVNKQKEESELVNYTEKGRTGRGYTLTGAIRWDAWTGDVSSGLEVQRTLSPEKYHYRLPFFAQFREGKHPLLNGTSQKIVDMEIHYAKTYGIDYWAILWYSFEMKYAREKYLQSMYRAGISWCHLWDGNFFGDAKNESVIQQVVDDFKKPYYVKTEDGRPVVYFFESESSWKDVIERLRVKCNNEGVPHPYIILMQFDLNTALKNMYNFGAHAVSRYTIGATDGIAYRMMRENEASAWNRYMQDKNQVVPTVTTGWDTRPRYDNPVIWLPNYESMKDSWGQQGTAEEIAAHLMDAIGFCNNNKDNSYFNSVIIYAWNENDEGGWLTPTYFELRDAGKPLRLETIRDRLITYKAAFTDISRSKYKRSIENTVVANVFGNIWGDKFEPEKEISRGEFVAYLFRALGLYAEGDYSYKNAEAWYYNELTYAGNFGLFGLKEDSFKPNVTITAGSAKEMISAACKTINKDINSYADINVMGLKNSTRLTRETCAYIIENLMETVFNLPTQPLYL